VAADAESAIGLHGLRTRHNKLTPVGSHLLFVLGSAQQFVMEGGILLTPPIFELGETFAQLYFPGAEEADFLSNIHEAATKTIEKLLGRGLTRCFNNNICSVGVVCVGKPILLCEFDYETIDNDDSIRVNGTARPSNVCHIFANSAVPSIIRDVNSAEHQRVLDIIGQQNVSLLFSEQANMSRSTNAGLEACKRLIAASRIIDFIERNAIPVSENFDACLVRPSNIVQILAENEPVTASA